MHIITIIIIDKSQLGVIIITMIPTQVLNIIVTINIYYTFS